MTTERAILDSLAGADGHLMPEKSLEFYANNRLTPEVPLTAIRAAAIILEARGEIVVIDHRDKGRRYQITDAGRARLAS